MRTVLLACLLVIACASGERPAGPADPGPADAGPAPLSRGVLREVIFHGACDASGAVPLSDRHFVVADDEDNVLRVYDGDAGGQPLTQTDLSVALGLPMKGKKRPKARELDLEAATRLGDRAYWLTSHGRNKKGEPAPERVHFFATTLLGPGGRIELIGEPYERLVDDLLATAELAPFGLREAATKPPKAEGGLNVEGLTAAPDGRVLLAFRNPVPRGRALLVPLLNMKRLVGSSGGGPARFGPPVLLNLGNRGVRSLSWWRGRFLLIAGAATSGGTSSLYTWAGDGPAGEVTTVDLSAYNPEGFFTPEDRNEVLIVSDDGERPVGGRACKKLKDPAAKRFRGVWVKVP